MQTKRDTAERSKVKIGTILDKGIVDKLKQRSIRDGKPISTIIEEAVLKYDQEESLGRELRLKALESLLAIKFNISTDDLREIMEEDYYEQ
ncbi:MAG: hypothetical protein V1799_17110 [bacterium]